MNTNAARFFHRHAIPMLAPFVLLLGACVTDPYEPVRSVPAPDLAGTRWTVTSIDGRETLNGAELTADFGVDGRVNGESGCNRFSGPFIQTGSTVSFGELLSSRRACAEANRQRQEDRMLAVMRGATSVRLARDELRLRGPSGSMTFVKAAFTDTTYPASGYPRHMQYDCQGVVLTVDYGENTAQVSWPDGNDVLERRTSDNDVVRYESAHSELRFGRDMLWGQQGGPTRTCFERH